MAKFFSIILLLIFCFSISLFAQNVGQAGDTIINYTDINGNKQGPWKKKYENGKIAYEATFKNNKIIGTYKRFYATGSKKSIVEYSPTGDYGKAVFYWDDGKLMAEGTYYNQNQKDSVWKYYATDGKLVSSESYSKGIKSGKCITYYRNGKMCEELNWEKGKKNGVWRTYFENGETNYEMVHKADIRTGPFNAYYPDGRLKTKGAYKNDLYNGKWIWYRTDGSVEKEIEYINGKAKNEDQLNEEFTKQMKEWDKLKGTISEPSEKSMFEGSGSGGGQNY